jgi:F-type H+-transporting ATPase subunit delta
VAAETSSHAGLAGRYATALYELAEEAKALDAVAHDLSRLRELIAGSDELRRLIASPLVPRAEQAKAMLGVIEAAGMNDLTRRFVGTVAANRRLHRINAIIAAFKAILAERRGEVTAEVMAARPLTPAQIEAVAAALRGAVGRKVSVDVKVDPKLLGGLKVKVGSRLVDASLAAMLQRLRRAMKGQAA